MKPRQESDNKTTTTNRDDADTTDQHHMVERVNTDSGAPESRIPNVEKLLRAREKETVTSPEEHQQEQPPEGEHVIDKIVDHGRCDDEDNPSAHIGDLLYRVRWYGFTSEDDTCCLLYTSPSPRDA